MLSTAVGVWYVQDRKSSRAEFVRDVESRWLEANILCNQAQRVRDKAAQWETLLTASQSALDRAEKLLNGRESQAPDELRSRIQETPANT